MAETTQLLSDWYGGDQQALNELFRKHLGTLRAMAHRKLGAVLRMKEETGDVVQEAVIKFFEYGPRIRIANERALLALLVRVVDNTLRDKHGYYHRQRRNMMRDGSLSETILDLDSPSSHAATREERAWVRLGMEFLDGDDRGVIDGRDWEQLSFAEVGERLGITENAARKRYLQAIMRLAAIVRRLRRGDVDQLLRESGDLEPL